MSEATPAASWTARLELGYVHRAGRTVLGHRSHRGPLRVQKALYPEGASVCHTLVLHPPAGIVGGDRLELDLTLGAHAHALLTTPGAGKWYRSAGPRAVQEICARLEMHAALEWLPQETILYDGAIGRQRLRVDLAEGAHYLGLEVLCLGRRAAGERFASGRFSTVSAIDQVGQPLWREWGTLHGGSAFLDSPVGLRGAPVGATVLAAGVHDASALVRALRAALPAGEWAVTALPGVLVARWLGSGGEAARAWFLQIWGILRPALFGIEAQWPRIWNT
jgi:urease accessory protein